ncbi:MAG TPA: hypothetical protein PKC99_06065 [Anaerolineales bacterium]|nr:hypothetical protein [Anaerolineales bacterium]
MITVPEICEYCGCKIVDFGDYWVCSNRWCDNRGCSKITEQELSELYEFASGTGKYSMLGDGIMTRPNGDAESRAIYEGCVELEKRGLLVRSIEEVDFVQFVSTGKKEYTK